MNVEIPANLTGKALYTWLTEKESTLIAQKKFEIKKADAVYSYVEFVNDKGEARKASDQQIPADATKLKARLIINTTKLFDSHSDVHIDGLWSKSLTESNLIYLLQEHSMTFKGIISDEVTAFTKSMSWKSLGASFEGNTQALVFDVIIDKNRNEYMFGQYLKKYVKNHSVGMRYMKIYMCINDEDYPAQFDAWNKYYPLIANKEPADQQGYFFAVTEAKVIEGSAVPRGSNFVTPTQSIEEAKNEPVNSTRHKNEPPKGTPVLDALKQLQSKFN